MAVCSPSKSSNSLTTSVRPPAPRSAACRSGSGACSGWPLLEDRHLAASLGVLLVEPVRDPEAQPVPASMNAIRSGKRTGTPVSSMETRFATIASGCASECTASAVRNCSSWNGQGRRPRRCGSRPAGRLLRGVVDGVVELVAVEGLEPGCRQVGADIAWIARVLADLLGAGGRALRRQHDRAAQGRFLAQPAVGEPLVVGAREGDGERGVPDRQREQVVREEHGLVHVQVVELARIAGRPDGLRAVRAAGPRDAVFRPRRHRGQVE